MIKTTLYHFKTIDEVAWLGMIAAVGQFLAFVLQDAPSDILMYVPLGATVGLRFVVGFLYGRYEFGALIEVVWAGVQAAFGVVALAVANTSDASTINASWIATLSSSAGRQFIAAFLGAGERAFKQ